MADNSLKQYGVYCIRNLVSGQIYVGSSIDIYHRWANHRSNLKNNIHPSMRLQRSWNEHGEKAFMFEVLEFVFSRSNLLNREQHWIDCLNAACPDRGFNVHQMADSPLGTKRTEEVRTKMGTWQIGKIFSDETKAKIAAARKGQKMKPQTPEHRAKMRVVNLGRKLSPEVRENMSRAQKKWRADRMLAPSDS